MYSIDENGGVRIWLPDEHGVITFSQRPHALRIAAKPAVVILAFDSIWTSSGKIIEVYNLKDNGGSLLVKRYLAFRR